jgi:anti-sigma factor RsiW
MNCEVAQECIVLAAYGELPDDQAHQLEQHLISCERCRQEMEAVAGLQKAMSVLPAGDPSPSLLAQTRVRLDEALDAMPQGGFLLRRWQSFRRGAGRLASAPVMASAVLLLGLGAGGWGGYRLGRKPVPPEKPALVANSAAPAVPVLAQLDPAQIARVSSVTEEPGTQEVEVRFDRVVPETVFGTVDDPEIRRLLVAAARDRANLRAHESSVDVLANECRNGRECSNGPVRNALMVALRYDHSASVRQKALEGLQPYIGDDMRVRDAVLEALLNDPDPGIRTEAIGLLTPVEADSSVREVLQTVANQDDNPYIRTVSREFLEQVSQQIQ